MNFCVRRSVNVFGVRLGPNAWRSPLLAALGCATLSGAIGSAQQAKPVSAAAASAPQAASAPAVAAPPAAKRPALAADYGKLPLSFEANRGQSDPQVKFLSRGNGYSLFLTDKAAVLALTKSEPCPKNSTGATPPFVISTGAKRMGEICGSTTLSRRPHTPKTYIVRMELDGASRGLQVEGAEPLPGTANYFLGNDPAKWRTNVPTYAKVKYAGVYPGVDLVYYGNQRQLEYDFVVAPGADPKSIRLHFENIKRLRLNADGSLTLLAHDGEVAFHQPDLYQFKDGRREPISGSFALLANNSVTFAPGSYDHTRPLVIDPVLAYSTYLGGTGYGTAIAADPDGDVYVAGITYGNGVGLNVTKGAFQSANKTVSSFDAFVTKINPAGTGILYSTYLGGSGDGIAGDFPASIKADSTGNAYIVGFAASTNFPAKNPLQPTNKGAANSVPNCFVTKLNPTGTALVYSTYLGGSGVTGHSDDPDNLTTDISSDGGDGCTSIALDAKGDAYVTGGTFSDNFPLAGSPLQSSNKGYGSSFPTAFVAKINPAGSDLVYSTYLGGSGGDSASSIALDASGNAYIAGGTQSTDFPAFGKAYQLKNPGAPGSGFVAKINAEGSALDYATYLGGSEGSGLIDSLAVDSSGDAYLYGSTTSSNFPTTPGAFQPKRKYVALYPVTLTISKLNPTGSSLVYSTYLNSNGGEFTVSSSGMALDTEGEVYVTGFTLGTNFPVSGNAFQATNQCAANAIAETAETIPQTGFVTELNTSGSALMYSTYFGGTGTIIDDWYDGRIYYTVEVCEDEGLGLAVDGAGGLYVTGAAASPDFPTTTGSSNPGAFIAKFNLKSSATGGTLTTLNSNANPQVVGGSITFAAHVESTSGSGIPAGSVVFTIDDKQVEVVSLDKTGRATYTTATLAEGSHVVKASYEGAGATSASNTSFTQTMFGAVASVSIVSGNNQSATYGSAFPSSIVVLVKDASGDPIPGEVVSFAGKGVDFAYPSFGFTGANGEVSITATAAGTGTLHATASVGANSSPTISITLTGKPAVLTVTANNDTIHYDHPMPAFSYTATGFVLQDTASVLSGAPVESTTAKDGSPGGSYPIDITQGTLKASNYTFKFVNGTLTIVQPVIVSNIALTVSPASAAIGSTFTAKALVTDSTGKQATSGTVSFYDGTFFLGSAPIVASTGTAIFKTRSLTPGTNSLQATGVLGQSISATASKSVTVTTSGNYETTAALSSSGAQGSYALTAALVGKGAGVPTGSFTYTDVTTGTSLGSATPKATNGGSSFTTIGTIAVGATPAQTLLADLNGDGIPDMLFVNYYSYTGGNWIGVMLGNGDGTFQTIHRVTTNPGSTFGDAVVVGDLNGDGKLDLVGAAYNGSGLAVFLGNGNGTFGAERDYEVDTGYATDIAVSDFNGDGLLDIVSVNYFGNTVSILLGKGDGTFQAEVPYAAGTNPNYVAVGDLNGDGCPDLAVTDSTGAVSILLGIGDGTFQAQQVIQINSDSLGTIAIGDINQDGNPDLVLNDGGADAIIVLLGEEEGTFKAPYQIAAPAGTAPAGLLVADLNRDGHLDVAIGSYGSPEATVFYGNGSGTFNAHQYPIGHGTVSITAGDINGDGLTDLAVPNLADGTVSVLLGETTYAAKISGLTLPGVGSDSVVATYSGNAIFGGSKSNTLLLKSNNSVATTPTFLPAAGTSPSAQTVAISDSTPDAIFYFTTNGTTPTTSSTRYSSPIKISATETMKAIAVAPGYSPSAVTTVTDTVTPAAAVKEVKP